MLVLCFKVYVIINGLLSPIPLYTATPYITPNVSFPKGGGIKGEDCIYIYVGFMF